MARPSGSCYSSACKRELQRRGSDSDVSDDLSLNIRLSLSDGSRENTVKRMKQEAEAAMKEAQEKKMAHGEDPQDAEDRFNDLAVDASLKWVAAQSLEAKMKHEEEQVTSIDTESRSKALNAFLAGQQAAEVRAEEENRSEHEADKARAGVKAATRLMDKALSAVEETLRAPNQRFVSPMHRQRLIYLATKLTNISEQAHEFMNATQRDWGCMPGCEECIAKNKRLEWEAIMDLVVDVKQQNGPPRTPSMPSSWHP